MSRYGAADQDTLRLSTPIVTCFRLLSSPNRERGYWDEMVERVEAIWFFMNGLGQSSDTYLTELFLVLGFRRLQGCEHRSTISAMSNLASTLGDQGHLEEAVTMKQEVLKKRKCILGEELSLPDADLSTEPAIRVHKTYVVQRR